MHAHQPRRRTHIHTHIYIPTKQTPDEIWAFEVPRAVPIVYHFDAAFTPLRCTQPVRATAAKGGGMFLPSQITATVLLPPSEDEEGGDNEWAARLPSNS
jgi:hypothetical protein